jgi:dihydropyrimidine dehydrogenase (NAD+) subunit PreA
LPVIVKLTPNISDIRLPARAAKKGGADSVSLINTINSIMGVDLDNLTISPATDGMGTHGGYCGPAVKPIALSMVSEIARDAETRKLPISGIGGVVTWKDAVDFMALGASNVQVCTAAMTYGFRIVEDLIDGMNDFLDSKGMKSVDELIGVAVPSVTDWQFLNLNYTAKARIDQQRCINCGRCYAACEDTSHQAISNMKDGKRYYDVIDEECVGCNLCINVCPEECIKLVSIAGEVDKRTGKMVSADYSNWTRHPNNPMSEAK